MAISSPGRRAHCFSGAAIHKSSVTTAEVVEEYVFAGGDNLAMVPRCKRIGHEDVAIVGAPENSFVR